MLRIAVLGSTRGTDLDALLVAQREKKLHNAEIALVVSNRPDAYIIKRARRAGIEALCIESDGGVGREKFEQKLVATLEQRKINFIVLIGFMKILSPVFLAHYPNRIINIHPSLLPKYAGGMDRNIHAEVLKNRDAVTGCTLHYVTEKVDRGPIILQREVPVLPNDTPETLKVRVQHAEQEVLLEGINKIAGMEEAKRI